MVPCKKRVDRYLKGFLARGEHTSSTHIMIWFRKSGSSPVQDFKAEPEVKQIFRSKITNKSYKTNNALWKRTTTDEMRNQWVKTHSESAHAQTPTRKHIWELSAVRRRIWTTQRMHLFTGSESDWVANLCRGISDFFFQESTLAIRIAKKTLIAYETPLREFKLSCLYLPLCCEVSNFSFQIQGRDQEDAIRASRQCMYSTRSSTCSRIWKLFAVRSPLT